MTINDFIEQIYIGGANVIYCSSDIDCFCSTCKETRRMAMNLQQYSNKNNAYYQIHIVPSLWICKCKQCETDHYLLIYNSFSGLNYVYISKSIEGIATPNTPVSVSYYLDQAYKARSMGANSACVAMFRAALEQVMFEQGFTRNMLGNKLADLEAAIKKGTAPTWTSSIDSELLRYIKELGDGSIHPNGGDVEKQKALDDEIIQTIDTLFLAFLFEIYEKPLQKKSLKDLLSKASTVLKR